MTLTEELISNLTPVDPAHKTVAMKKYVGNTDGTVTITDARKSVVRVPSHRAVPNATKFGSAQKYQGGSYLDRLVTGEATEASEAAIWEAGRQAAEDEGMACDGQALLQWNRIVGVLIAARRGIVVSPLELSL